MAPSRFYRLEEYFDPRRSLNDRFAELSDPTAIAEPGNSQARTAVMGFVNKYLCEYLRLTSANVSDLQQQIQCEVNKREEEEIPKISQCALQGKAEGKSDIFGVQCLADVRTTAALVQEIAFNRNFESDDGQFMGVDLGSGTGILGAAMAIAALRKSIREPCIALIDCQERSLQESERVVGALDRTKIQSVHADLRNPLLYRLFGPPINVQYWVSETFTVDTPEVLSISARNIEWDDNDVHRFLNGFVDPYADVMNNLLRYVPYVYERVRTKKAALFPNIINGQFVPSRTGATLRLETSRRQQHLPLRDISDEFAAYEDFGTSNSRWF